VLFRRARLPPRQRAGSTSGSAADFRAVLDGTAEPTLYERALLDLSAYLHAHHGEKVVILIDEYDEPIHAGHVHGYSAEILDFMRAFLGAGLKGNPHLFKAVMTGILRVAKENLFSGLNNLGVYTAPRRDFHLLRLHRGRGGGAARAVRSRGPLEDVRAWYNGYLFGGEVIYNPWSVLCFLDSSDARAPALLALHELQRSGARAAGALRPHAPAGVRGAARRGQHRAQAGRERGPERARPSEDALWSLLVFSGYLKAEEAPDDALGRAVHRLSIPNREVREVYSSTFAAWMKHRVEGHGGRLADLTEALLTGDAEVFEEQLQAFVTNVLSYHDPGKLHPERVYHGFLVGLLAVLEPGHQVRSNRESGKGRPDVLIRPTRPANPVSCWS
jgi:hypothetical protein